ncbi:HXXEE domain-containing protein [Cellulomonas sp. NPDC089187]|uniref:HXXEE domain-containing protein n=1 Tax=Cellulomonas sp. NPDC089187 TaxID=3154970 RepID=UPI00341598C8
MDELTRTCGGLLGAWLVHDAEEWLTMGPTSAELLAAVPQWVPLPENLRCHGLSDHHVRLSITLTGVLVAVAAADGVRTRGTSTLFRGALLLFGAHGVTHQLASVTRRGYTTGVVTAPLVVVPHWWRARRVLRRHGVRDLDRRSVLAAVAMTPLLLGAHLLSYAILGERSIRPVGSARGQG